MEELLRMLHEHGINTESWGKGTTKTVEDLQTELDRGESSLVAKDGKLQRIVSVLLLEVYCEIDGRRYHLYEDRQVHKDGSVLRREDVPNSVSEKVGSDELPPNPAVIRRALYEELGIKKFITAREIKYEEKAKPPKTYPDIPAEYHYYWWEVEISESDFKPEGYVEVQEKKSTYFVWELCN
jgi:hypothetical protein